jgi:hypothetical protein
MPAPQGEKLRVAEQGTEGDDAMQTVYRSGVGKLLHLTRWSRPDIRMAVQSLLTRFGGRAGDKHLKAMHRVMQYCINTQYRRRKIKPNRLYQGDESTVHFKVAGRSDSDFASDEETRSSITGASATFERVSVAEKCKLQGYVTLSVTEAEYGAATESAQDMLFVMRLIESIGLKAEQPMILERDNKEAIDLNNKNCSSSGRTRHIDTKFHFLRELKEQDTIHMKQISTLLNSTDMFTKNVGGPLFEDHAKQYCTDDDYYGGDPDDQHGGMH